MFTLYVHSRRGLNDVDVTGIISPEAVIKLPLFSDHKAGRNHIEFRADLNSGATMTTSYIKDTSFDRVHAFS